MAQGSFTAALSNRFKQKIIPATIVDVLGSKCTVRLSGDGTKLTGLSYSGNVPSKGDSVFVDYRNSTIPSVISTAAAPPNAGPTIKDCQLPNSPNVVPKNPEPYPWHYTPYVPPSYGGGPKTYTWIIDNPVKGGIPGPRLNAGIIITRIDAFCVDESLGSGDYGSGGYGYGSGGYGSGGYGSTVTFNIEDRAVIGTPGDDIIFADVVADTAGIMTVASARSSLAAGHWLWLDISEISGFPGKLAITVST